tara:strand:- start:13581 stop:14513 length:933 start_codon:yes stop_codon:yes gene_type:complete
MNKENTIFISIASYRDSELIPTIQDCIKNASMKYHLIFGICIQDENKILSSFPYSGKNFKIKKIHYTKSKGCSWARKIIQDELYNGEKYYMQIDSHTRFIKNWNKELIKMIHKCPSKKPIISTYPNSFKQDDCNKTYLENKIPYRIAINKFESNGYTLERRGNILNHNLTKSLWIAAGFIFTYGYWNKEVHYDKRIYFGGEEDNLTIKSYTHGWDIFCPNKSIIYHLYNEINNGNSKDKRILHWEDHHNYKNNYHLLENLYNGKNIGNKRTIQQFEKDFGINFKSKKINKNAKEGLCIDDFNKKKSKTIK